MRQSETSGDSGMLLKVLTGHYQTLVTAGADESLLREYSALLRFVRSAKWTAAATNVRATSARQPPRSVPELQPELRGMSLDELELRLSDDATTRKQLEAIAIERFSVPRGSMRSFSNREMVINKLLTLIRNERAHETISTVAREQGKLPPDS